MASTFREIILNSINKYAFPLFILFIVLLFLGLGYWTYKTYAPKLLKNIPYDDVSNASATSKTAIVTFYYASWCPACKKAKPEWDKFKQEYSGEQKQVNGYYIMCQEVDCSNNEDPEIASTIQKHNVTGFPTIQMYVDNNTINFDSPISQTTLDLFVSKMLN